MQKPAYHTNDLLSQLWLHFSSRRKIQFCVLLLLMVLTTFAEIFSIGAVLPFLAALTDPESLFETPQMQPVLAMLNITSPEEMLLPLTMAFCIAAILAGAMRLFQAWSNARVSFLASADLGIDVYRRTLYQPYSIHILRNSSTIINAVSTKTVLAINGCIMPAIIIITSGFLVVSILLTLILIDPFVALSAFSGFGLTYALIIVLTRKRVEYNGTLIARESNVVLKSLQEGLGGIRDVIIDGSQEVYAGVYGRAVFPLYRAQASVDFISQSPRFGIEAIGMTLIALLAYWLVGQPGGFAGAIPVLGALAFGAQRMLPALQQIYAAWSRLQGNLASLIDVIELLEQPLPEQRDFSANALQLKDAIELKNLHFCYSPDRPEVLRDLNLTIPLGSKVGFIGVTGSGKSTLLDILMGLLQPTSGKLLVNGTTIDLQNSRAWQRNIAHVPQLVFLSDSSIEENIAFGVPEEKIDHELVRWAAEQAQIAEFIDSLPKKYKSSVGERGVNFSGGQRQRIGIARALYKQANVIIFDEATSALDDHTEAGVIKAISELDGEPTILMVAHRFTSLKNCDIVVELDGGAISRMGTYEEIILRPSGTI